VVCSRLNFENYVQNFWNFLQIFSKGVKDWLKIQHISTYNFGGRGSDPMKLCHTTCHKVAIITYVQLLGGIVRLKFGSAKTCDFRQLSTLTANISGIGIDIKNWKET